MIYFTSDTHFGHANVIGYCGRPFALVEEMDEELIRRWNARVQPSDVVYHLGDFAFKSREFAAGICRRLLGHKVLVRGNHDRSAAKMFEVGFDEVHDTFLLNDALGMFRLSHVPPDGADRDGLKVPIPSPDEPVNGFLCGHVHEKWRHRFVAGGVPVINVGVDQWGFEPKTLAELLEVR